MKAIYSLALTMTLVGSLANAASTIETYCTNLGSNLTYTKSERFPERNGVALSFSSLAGMETAKYQLDELNTSLIHLSAVESKESPLKTFCGIDQNISKTMSVYRIQISKINGKEFFSHDDGEKTKKINEIVLCSTMIIDEWPCK